MKKLEKGKRDRGKNTKFQKTRAMLTKIHFS